MAKASSKKTAGLNDIYLRNLRIGLVLTNLINILVRLVKTLFGYSFLPRSFLVKFLSLSTPIICFIIYNHFATISTPTKDRLGKIINGGEDLGGSGVVEFLWDVVYITWICQIGSALFGDKVWYLYLAVPGIAVYKLYTTFYSMYRAFRGGSTAPAPSAKIPPAQIPQSKAAAGGAGSRMRNRAR